MNPRSGGGGRGGGTLTLHGRQVHLLQVAVRERDQPPDDGEAQPGQHERQREHDQRPAPLRVHQRGEHVLQEADAPLRDALLRHVALAVLQDGAAAQFAARAARPRGAAASGCWRRMAE